MNKISRKLGFILALVCFTARAGATELSDLGQGLSVLRLVALTAAGRAPASPLTDTPALVLDLRDTTADEPSVAALLAALRARPAGKGVCLVLLSPDTAPALLAALSSTPPGCLTVGRADGACRPDISVVTTADADKRARAALAAGTPFTALLAPPSAKPRHDEAELAKDHAAGKSSAAQPDPETSPSVPAQPKPQNAQPEIAPAALSVDAVLQHAVQVHRGLLALGKI